MVLQNGNERGMENLDSVTFFEEGHKYTNESGEFYISGTTLLGKYKAPYDGEFWSKYKAIERTIIELAGEAYYTNWKQKIGGFMNVNKAFDAIAREDSKALVQKHTIEVLQEWEYEKTIAGTNGSNFHYSKEEEWAAADKHFDGVIDKKWYNLGIQQDKNGKNRVPSLLEDGVYSEMILWLNDIKLAGAADIIYIETIDGIRYVDIDDYKTNKKVDTSGFMGAKMNYPVNHLEDCNFQHYELQMSLYCYMLELNGFTIRHLNFQHWKNIGTKENPSYEFNRNYPLKYRREEIVSIIEDYKVSLDV